MSGIRNAPRPKYTAGDVAVRSALAGCTVLFGCGCAQPALFTKPFDYHGTPESGAAYLYGRFEVRSSRDGRKQDEREDHATLALHVECTRSRSYRIRFTTGGPLQLIEISPAECSISEVLFTTAYGDVVGRKAAPMWLMWNEEFAPGTAYYVGDFFGVTQESDAFTKWALSEVRDDYESTTRLLKAWCPAFAQMPTVHRVQLPPETEYDPFAI